MKKLFLLIYIFSINLNAAKYEYNTKCPQWEIGSKIIYEGVQIYNPPAKDFCWDATKIEGYGIYNGVPYRAENLTSKQTIANWYANDIEYVYGEDFIGLYVYVVVMGYESKTPVVTLNGISGKLISSRTILSPSGNTYNGKEFKFFMRHIPLSQYTGTLSERKMSGELKVHDIGYKLKETTYIN
ncbi:hypothetical protein N5U14_05240 [Aliarcobacter butzleri]|uniref:hypothetical protein n=1 Tax=Aliarcobacter butzleri TaxID=28197 RepID=UPI0021B2AA20|nr:hypothetical protein [Aliarcobacter butzleri]MCT7610241.1 hypothetical protein [Aliarcobacter butzleri]